MKYRQLADTGVFVSELCLGAMTFGGRGQMWERIGGLDQPAVDGIVHRALDAGINFVDTANVYASGESEIMLGSYYSLVGRELEREMIPLLKDQGLGLLVWSPLAGDSCRANSRVRAATMPRAGAGSISRR